MKKETIIHSRIVFANTFNNNHGLDTYIHNTRIFLNDRDDFSRCFLQIFS